MLSLQTNDSVTDTTINSEVTDLADTAIASEDTTTTFEVANSETVVIHPLKRPWWSAIFPVLLLAVVCATALWQERSAHNPKGQPTTQSATLPSDSTISQTDEAALRSLLKEPIQPIGGAPSPIGQPPNLGQPGSGQPSTPLGAPVTALPSPTPLAATSPGRDAYTRGEQALRSNNPTAASSAFQEALRLDTKLVPAHLRLAELSARAGKIPEAQAHLDAAIALTPQDPTPRLQLSQLYAQTNQAAKAESAARGAAEVAKGPVRRVALGNYARILTAANKAAPAYEIWSALLKSNPQDAEAALSASLLASEKLNKPKDGERLLAQAAKMPVTNPEVALLTTRVLAQRRKIDDANRILLTATKKFPVFIPLHTTLAELRLARGDSKGAIAVMRAIMGRIPDKVQGGAVKAELHLEMARVLAASNQVKGAISEAQKSAAMAPRSPEPPAFLADLYLSTGNLKSGEAALRRVLQLDSRNLEARRGLATVLARSQRWEAAQKEMETYIKAEPRDMKAVADLATIHERAGRPQKSLQLWNDLAKKNPDSPVPALNQARLLSQTKQPEAALERYRFALTIQPDEPEALLGAADIEEKRGEDMRALAHLKSAIQVAPKFDPAYVALMRVAKKRGQGQATINFLKQQLNKDPNRPAAAYAAILDYYESTQQTDMGRDIVKGYIDKNKKLTSPRVALDEFDLRRAKAQLSDLLKKDKEKAAQKPTAPPSPPTPAGSPVERPAPEKPASSTEAPVQN